MTFFDNLMMFTKQNDHDSVGTLYKEVLGELVIRYDSIYKFKKGLRWGIYNIMQGKWAYLVGI